MLPREGIPSQRNRTLPLKKSDQMRSASKIKISRKGLPKDFFNSYLGQSFVRSNKIRCKTQSCNKQLEETSYFQHSETLSPKRETRQYKSEQRRRPSTETEKHERHHLGKKDNRSDVLECTFFKSVALQKKQNAIEGDESDPLPLSRRIDSRQRGLRLSDLEPMRNNSDMNGVLRPRECVNFNRLRPGLYKGLPMIRLCKPKAK